MSIITIQRVKCDACSHTTDTTTRDDAWLHVESKTYAADEYTRIDLCAKCAGIFMKRCAEVGIKL